ncbi:integral membrane family protein [Pestalotiopsis sp. NC0098]|nr:integral membrane family protein [Pestalotiopsis sp. NC0098]
MAAQDPSVSTESNGAPLVNTAAAFLALTWASVLLRTYVRAIMLNFQTDDWFMVIAQINFTISCTFIFKGVQYGIGRHNKSLDQLDEIQGLKYQALATATYVANMMFIKLSIAVFLLRLAPHNLYRYILHASILIVSIWSIVLFFWNLFQCHPVEAQWDYRILADDKTAFCVPADEVVAAAYSLSVMTILSDWLYALIPIPMVWHVKMTKQAKTTVVLVLGLGIFASVATLIRLKFLADLTQLDDLLFATTDTMIWTIVEPGVAIVAASLITIRPLLRAWRVRGFVSTENTKRTDPISHGHGNRASGMPSLGSKDRTNIDVEAAQSSRDQASDAEEDQGPVRNRRFLSPIAEASHKDFDMTDDRAVKSTARLHRRSEAPSEMYIIEGPPSPQFPGHTMYNDTWSSAHSATSSDVELAMMEPVKQSDGRIGLGSPKS